jgi:hypothetical protein
MARVLPARATRERGAGAGEDQVTALQGVIS